MGSEKESYYRKFPSIEPFRKIAATLKHQQGQEQQPLHLKEISYLGTAKLDGSHADLILDKGEVFVHSRTHLVTPSMNVMKLYNYLETYRPALQHFLELVREACLARGLDPEGEAIQVAGEYCGLGINNRAAISTLDHKAFVAYNIRVGKRGVLDTATAAAILTPAARDIDRAARVYTITQGSWDHPADEPIVYEITMQVPEPTQAQNARLEALVDRVYAECPFSATFGVKGLGEGIVWVPKDPKLACNPGLWFKAVHPKFEKPQHPIREPKAKATTDFIALDGWLDMCLTQNRLEQGYNAVGSELATADGNHVPCKDDIKWVIDWMYDDCIKEEGDSLPEACKPKNDKADGAKKRMSPCVAQWFKARLAQDAAAPQHMAPQQ